MDSNYTKLLENLDVFFILGLMAVSLITGRLVEYAHYKSLERREDQLDNQTIRSRKQMSIPAGCTAEARLVCGEAVVGVEFFRWVMGAFKGMFGGHIRSYESIIDRARREAVLRMRENAGNAAEIVNVRLEYAPISYGISSKSSCVEAIAYGTAVYWKNVDETEAA